MIAYFAAPSKGDCAMTVQQLLIPCQPVESTDPVAMVLDRLRSQPLPVLPVVAAGRLLGVVSEDDVAGLLDQAPDPDAARLATAGEIASRDLTAFDYRTPLEEAARVLAERGLAAAPIVGPQGHYLGMLRRSDLLAAHLGSHRPPPRSIAGLATPLGVRLVCGRVSAGAGLAGLLLTGAVMALLLFVAMGLANVALWSIESHWPRWPIFTMLIAAPTEVNQAYFADRWFWSTAALGLYVLYFLALMRAAPLAGTHGAEHKVVHAIEHGQPLTLEAVRPMPTVHPRCGTNLAALAFVLIAGVVMLTEGLPAIALAWGWSGVVGALVLLAVAALLARTRIGPWLQGWFTTREPGDRRLAAAIAVGEELLRRYQDHPPQRLGFFSRIWMIGMPHVFVGLAAASVGLYFLSRWLYLGIAY
jgi:CBS domain-containing protein